jgi:hypothetical protein
MLTPIGLLLNFFGSVLLLGSDVKLVERAVKRVDPVHLIYMKEINRIVEESTSKELVKNGRAHPYDQSVKGHGLTWWPVRWFLNRHVEQDIPRNAEIDIQGGWFKINNEQLTLSEAQRIPLESGGELSPTATVSLTAVFGLFYNSFLKRIYIYGVSSLAIGFLFQLISWVC